MNKNLNIIKKNKDVIPNELKNNYYSLLKRNYIMMSAYQIFYLYSSFNEECDYYLLKYAFKKWKK